MNLLARREYSRLELSTRLLKRFGKREAADMAPEEATGTDTLAEEVLVEAELAEEALVEADLAEEALKLWTLELRQCIAQELTRLANEGLQSDARLAEAFIRARTNKGRGPVKIRAELKQKGVATAVIDAAFNHAEVNWRELATGVTLKKFGKEFGDQGPIRLQDKARVERFLRQRGFIPGDL